VVVPVAGRPVGELADAVELEHVAHVLHGVPHGQRPVPTGPDRLLLGLAHEDVGVDEHGEHQRGHQHDQDPAGRHQAPGGVVAGRRHRAGPLVGHRLVGRRHDLGRGRLGPPLGHPALGPPPGRHPHAERPQLVRHGRVVAGPAGRGRGAVGAGVGGRGHQNRK
jgi:hypothetical protein